MTIVYLNGQYLPEEQAMVPVSDRGFMLGDGIYEVIPAYHGRLFRFEEHLQRLKNSLDAVRIDNPYTDSQWREILESLLEQNSIGESDASLYLQLTRGVARRDHAFPEGVVPTVYAQVSPVPPTDVTLLENGISAITVEDIRWKRCDIKTISLLPNVLIYQQAREAEAAEAIMLRDGILTEGAASNVFVVEEGRLLTPPKSPGLLPGITRDVVVELAAEQGIECDQVAIPEAQLRRAQEIWITSSTREIIPVTRLDGEPVGDGRPGPLWAIVYNCYQEFKRKLRKA